MCRGPKWLESSMKNGIVQKFLLGNNEKPKSSQIKDTIESLKNVFVANELRLFKNAKIGTAIERNEIEG